MIPDHQSNGELPPGIYETTLEEIRQRFGYNSWRLELISGLEAALSNLRAAGVRRVYIDGSFTAKKAYPGDIDGCWDVDEQVNEDRLDPVFLDFFSFEGQAMMKEKYHVHFFISQVIEGALGVPFVEFFQQNRNGEPKGILLINL
jgi:hypothetical protein